MSSGTLTAGPPCASRAGPQRDTPQHHVCVLANEALTAVGELQELHVLRRKLQAQLLLALSNRGVCRAGPPVQAIHKSSLSVAINAHHRVPPVCRLRMNLRWQRYLVCGINWATAKLHGLNLAYLLFNVRRRTGLTKCSVGAVRSASRSIVLVTFKEPEWPLRLRNQSKVENDPSGTFAFSAAMRPAYPRARATPPTAS